MALLTLALLTSPTTHLASTQWPCTADTHPLIRGLLELLADLMASQPGAAPAGVAAAGAEATAAEAAEAEAAAAAAAAAGAEAAGAAAAAGGARTAQAFEVTTSLLLPA